MEHQPAPKTRAARRALKRSARKRRIKIRLAAALAAAGLLLFAVFLIPRGDYRAAFAPVADAEGTAAVPIATVSAVLSDTAQPDSLATADTGIIPITPGEGILPNRTATPFTGLAGAENTPAPAASPFPAEEADTEPVTLTLSAAGDCTLGGDPSSHNFTAFKRAYQDGGAEYFFKNVRTVFEADDLTIVNLEGPLTNATRHRKKKFAFRGDPAYAKILTAGSVEVANLANNHMLDYYEAGMNDTAAALKKAGVARSGWGRAAILEVKGVRVGFCGVGMWFVSKSGLKKEVEALSKECDLVVVSIHGGKEGEGRAYKIQRDYARAAVNAGAKLVLMHHPHVIGAIEVYKGATIVYSQIGRAHV